MSWGDALAAAYLAAGDTARQAAGVAMNSAREAGAMVTRAAETARDAAAASVQAAGRVADFGARATAETLQAAGRGALKLTDRTLVGTPVVGKAYTAAKKLLSPTKPPRKTAVEPCPNTLEGKIQRMEKRESLIRLGKEAGSTPEQKAAAERLARNNEAVELARLSEDAYPQYRKPPKNEPPLGWSVMSDAELAEAGIDKRLLEKSKAVIYRTPADWPGGQKTVLAFRGTEPSEAEDLKTNADQALGVETAQYKAASQLGMDVAEKLGPAVLVTGHSLGGGKAQAAGTKGGLKGMMFNSSGLHPNSVDGMMPPEGQFSQYRAPGDPLTGIQNSAALQTGVGALAALAMPFGAGATAGNFLSEKLGMPTLSADMADAAAKGAAAFPRAVGNLLSQGNLMPPAVGRIIEAPSLDDQGKPVPATDLLGQHSVHNLVNGIEREKSEDVATLQET